MTKRQETEAGFPTKLIYDTKTPEFVKNDTYYIIDKLEVYYTTEGILGLFPSYEKKEMNKEIEANSFYLEFQKNLGEITQKLKKKNLELKHEVTYINDIIQDIRLIYDSNKQQIKALKFACNQKINIYGNFTLFNKRDYTLLTKRNHFITGMKTSYIKDNDDIPYLSYVQCYFAEFFEYEKYYYHGDKSNIFIRLYEKFLNFLLLPFIIFDKFFCFCLRCLKSFLKIGIVLAVLLGIPFYFYWKSQNILSGTFTVSEKNSNYEIKNNDVIKIYTDEKGLSHIKANSREDAYFALGFEHAKHKLFQIDVNRRIARGSLSEIFGKRTIETDKLLRSFGFNEYSKKALENFRKTSQYQKEINAYVAGINYYGNNFKLPIEYYITGAKFYDYTITDVIATYTMFSFTMDNDYDIEVLYQYLEREMGKDFVENVFKYRDTDYPFWNATILNDLEIMDIGLSKNKKSSYNNGKKDKNEQKDNIKEKNSNIENNINTEKIDESIIGETFNNAGASNCFNIEGKYTKSGKPLLCNDPHLPNSQPNIFFVAKIYLPDIVISGSTISGLPVFISGSNSYVAWGATTENSDNTDFCEEIIQGDYYIKDNKNYPLKIVKEIINVKGSDPIELEVKYTENGPIIGKTVPGIFTLFREDFESNFPLSLRIGFMKHEFKFFDFFFRVNLAHSPNDFLPYKNESILANYNMHWISKDGQIGYTTLGLYNLKRYQNRFCHGFSSEDDIINEVPQEEMLSITSPKKGYIVSANNSPAPKSYLYKLVGNHNNARAYRVNELIKEFIKNNTKISVNDSLNIIKDIKDENAAYVLPKFLKILEKNMSGKELKENKYYQMLKKWNFEFDLESREATLFSLLERYWCTVLVSKKLSKDKAKPLLNYFPYYKFIHGMIEKIYNGEKIALKECTYFDNNDDCEQYFVKVFKHLDEYIGHKFLEPNNQIKKWGNVNFNYFPHNPFDDVFLLKNIFSRKRYVSGNKDTVKISRSTGNNKLGEFVASQTPRIEFICDMSEPEEPYLSIAGGNGGSPIQMYYNNLMDEFEAKKIVHFKKIDFNDVKNKNRMITLEKKRN